MPGGFDEDDAATTASVKSGVPGQSQSRPAISGPSDPYLNDKPLPREPASAGAGHAGSSRDSTHDSLTGKRYPDRSVGKLVNLPFGQKGIANSSSSTGNNARQTESSRLSKDTAEGANAVGAGTSSHRHENDQHDNYAPATGRSFPLVGNSDNATPDSIHGTGRAETNQTGGAEGSSNAGPHSSNFANKADPRVDSDLDGSGTAGIASGGSGYDSGTGATPSSGNQDSLGHDPTLRSGAEAGAGLGSSGYGTESREHEHAKHSHGFLGDPCKSDQNVVPGPHFVQGPHSTDTANRLDPNVGSDSGGTTTGNIHGLGSHKGRGILDAEATTGTSTGHHGRDAAIASTGVRVHESARDTDTPASADLGSSTAVSHGRDTVGVGATTRSGITDKEDSSRNYHKGQDLGLAAAGIGGGAVMATGVGPHNVSGTEFDSTVGSKSSGHGEHLGSRSQPMVASTPQDQIAGSGHQPATTSQHHHARDAGTIAGATGLGAYQANKHSGGSQFGSASTPQDQLAGSGQAGETIEGVGTGILPGHGSRKDADHANPPIQNTGDRDKHVQDPSHDHHIRNHKARDAGVVGALGTDASSPEFSRKDADYANAPTQSSDYRDERVQDVPQEHHHRGRDAGVVGGVAGTGALAQHEYKEKEDEKLQKAHEKALEKEHQKELKDHQKELKHHDKQLAKEHHKEEKKHQEEHQQGKKHGGLLGLFHRDKPDKDDKEEEVHRKASTAAYNGQGETDLAAGAGPTGVESHTNYDPLAHEHGSQSGVHDTPIGVGSGLTTHDAYGQSDPNTLNKLHKDPPAKVLESRGLEHQ